MFDILLIRQEVIGCIAIHHESCLTSFICFHIEFVDIGEDSGLNTILGYHRKGNDKISLSVSVGNFVSLVF